MPKNWVICKVTWGSFVFSTNLFDRVTSIGEFILTTYTHIDLWLAWVVAMYIILVFLSMKLSSGLTSKINLRLSFLSDCLWIQLSLLVFNKKCESSPDFHLFERIEFRVWSILLPLKTNLSSKFRFVSKSMVRILLSSQKVWMLL